MNRIAGIALGLSCTATAWADQTLEHRYRTTGAEIRQAFAPVQQRLQKCSAVIQRGREELVYGTVLSSDGYIFTKASELGDLDGLSVIVDQRTYESPRRVATDEAWDVALLKIEATELEPVTYAESGEVRQGTWVVANGATTRRNRRVQVGVISANAREVYAKGGTVLGLSLSERGESEEGGLEVSAVTEGAGAAEAGIREGDRLMQVSGETLTEVAELLHILEERRVGERVPVIIRRDGEEIELEVRLSGRAEVFGEERDRNDAMSGAYSERRTGFPRVIQHDIIANRQGMGGPVLNLNGQCVGMNIARFNRSETYAIPAAELQELAQKMTAEVGYD